MTAERAIAIQGVAYAGLALALGFSAASLPALDPTMEIVIVAALVLVLGVPHGAFDPLYARRLFLLSGWRRWTVFGFGYWAAAALVVAAWALAPTLFLAGFLLASLAHFSGDPEGRTAALARIAMGGAPIVLPTLLHEAEVARLFGLLVGAEPGAVVAGALAAGAWPFVLLVALAVVWETHRDRGRTALELAATATVAILAPPLLAFAAYFCLMHSARHILRTARAAPTTAPAALAGIAAAPMLGTLALAGAAWLLMSDVALDARVMQVLFVGLAALTAPHMALVERARLRGFALTEARDTVEPADG